MAEKRNEPQSYGSQKEWLTGKTGEKVNQPAPPAGFEKFYESRHDDEVSVGEQGGKVSPLQAAESVRPAQPTDDEQTAGPGVTVRESGAKRGSYFKRRDYE